MNQHQDLARLSAVDLCQGILDRHFSAVEVAEACLHQVEHYNGMINAICTLSDDLMDKARKAEEALLKGEDVGPLHGLPVGIKDVTPTAGIRTTYGCSLYADHVPEEDALVVQRLKQAGALVLGKTNTPEFATGGNTFNEIFGSTRNPWNPELSAGGSTGGGAAGLATGMIAFAEGTDLGGSLRIPASFCGVVGLRPSPGLVPTAPSEYIWDTMQVTGGIARTAEDLALVLQAISGPSPQSPLHQPIQDRDFLAALDSGDLSGLRLAYCPDIAGIGIDDGVEGTCRSAAEKLAESGAQVEEIEFDLSFAWEPFLSIRGFWMVAQQYSRLDKIDAFGPNLKGNIERGLETSMKNLAAAESVRGIIWRRFQELFSRFDHLLTPCMAVPPFPVDQNYPETIAGKEMKTYIDWVAPTFLLSMAGLPVGSVPCGLDPMGLPAGLQVVGPQFGEESVLALMSQIQMANPIGLPSLAFDANK